MGPLGIHLLKGVLSPKRSLPSGRFGTGMLNNYHVEGTEMNMEATAIVGERV